MNTQSCLILASCMLFPACEALGPTSRPTPREGEARVSGTALSMATGAEALQQFVPAVQPRRVGGECMTMPAPAIPGVPAGSRLIFEYYPTRGAAHTESAVRVDSSGRIIRYSETWGVQRSSNPDLNQAIAEMDSRPSTRWTLDFGRDDGFVRNSGAGAQHAAVRAAIADFERNEHFRGLHERAESVLSRCGGR